ncbi:hypothetical protein K8I85_08745, partial [bacterium]|nr:hypothetical protein [bacterium]
MGALGSRLEAEIRIRLADCYRDLNDHEASYRVIGPVLDDPPDSLWRARALVRLARVLYFRGDPDAARAASVDAVQLLAPTDHHDDYAQAQLWLGHSLRLLGDSDAARSALRAAVASARRGRSAWLEAGALGSLGHLETRSGRLRDAERALSEALQVDTDASHRAGQAKTRLHLAVCRLHAGNWSGFEESLAGAERAYRELGDRRGLALTTLMRARSERLRGRDGGRWLDEAAEHAASSADARARVQVSEERGYVALECEEFAEAVRIFEGILARIRIEEVGEDMIFDCLGGLARGLAGLGRRDEAEPHAQQAVWLSTEANDRLAAASAGITLGLVREDAEPIEASIAVLSAAGARCELLSAHRAAAHVLRRKPARAWHLEQEARLVEELGLEGKHPERTAWSADDIAQLEGMVDVVRRAREMADFEGGILVK